MMEWIFLVDFEHLDNVGMEQVQTWKFLTANSCEEEQLASHNQSSNQLI